MALRGIRGATTVSHNSAGEIVSATQKLLSQMIKVNKVDVDEVASVIFSVTKDLNAEFPAAAARKIGWLAAPLLCTYEVDVPHSLKKCIRVLLHVNTDKSQKAMKHVYLGNAKLLRPDLKSKERNRYYTS